MSRASGEEGVAVLFAKIPKLPSKMSLLRVRMTSLNVAVRIKLCPFDIGRRGTIHRRRCTLIDRLEHRTHEKARHSLNKRWHGNVPLQVRRWRMM